MTDPNRPPPDHPTHGNHGRGTYWKAKRDRRRRHRKFAEQQGLCWWCKKPMTLQILRPTQNGDWKDHNGYATFEHLIPKSHGGSGYQENIVLAHASCNRARHKRKWPHDPIYGEACANGNGGSESKE